MDISETDFSIYRRRENAAPGPASTLINNPDLISVPLYVEPIDGSLASQPLPPLFHSYERAGARQIISMVDPGAALNP